MEKPKILLTCSEKVDNNNLSLICNHYYIEAIKNTGGIPILSDPSYKGLEDELIDIVQGIVLTGGGDVAPHFYGEDPHPETKYIDEKRDEFEIKILKKGVQKGLPIFGICRGIQLINVAFGGKLYQDLPNHTYNKNHMVNLKEDSFLKDIFKKDKIEVNSYHHQAINKVAPNFDIIAKTDDDIIEAIILKDKEKFVLGVQWHPERMYEAFKKLFKKFIEIVKEER